MFKTTEEYRLLKEEDRWIVERKVFGGLYAPFKQFSSKVAAEEYIRHTKNH